MTQDPEGTQRLRIRDTDITWRELEKGTLVLDLRSATYISLNPSGSLLWQCLSTGTTRTELVQELVDRLGADQARAERDVNEFLATLEARELLAPPTEAA
jgi:hypothetical protein